MDSHGVSISRFMKWAAERIAKEVEDNERIEAQAGTRDFIPGSRSTKKQDYTEDEKLAIMKTVDEMREQGYTAIQAVKQFGIHTCILLEVLYFTCFTDFITCNVIKITVQ